MARNPTRGVFPTCVGPHEGGRSDPTDACYDLCTGPSCSSPRGSRLPRPHVATVTATGSDVYLLDTACLWQMLLVPTSRAYAISSISSLPSLTRRTVKGKSAVVAIGVGRGRDGLITAPADRFSRKVETVRTRKPTFGTRLH
jgi:hypothetical protein